MYYPSTTAFDPYACALIAHVVEQTASTCIFPALRRRVVPRARRWLHSNSERVADGLVESAVETGLDFANSLEPRLACFLLVVIWLRVVVVSGERMSSSERAP